MQQTDDIVIFPKKTANVLGNSAIFIACLVGTALSLFIIPAWLQNVGSWRGGRGDPKLLILVLFLIGVCLTVFALYKLLRDLSNKAPLLIVDAFKIANRDEHGNLQDFNWKTVDKLEFRLEPVGARALLMYLNGSVDPDRYTCFVWESELPFPFEEFQAKLSAHSVASLKLRIPSASKS
jgi:MFS family permease